MVNPFFRFENCFVYEIYPQSEKPHLTKVAHLEYDQNDSPSAYLLPGTVIFYELYRDRIAFWVWDYRLNHSISFSVVVVVDELEVNLILKALK